MQRQIKERVLEEATHILKTKQTIRELAKEYRRSKSSVHHDLNVKLEQIDKDKYHQVKELFQEHIEIRHIRGGLATKEKYRKWKKA